MKICPQCGLKSPSVAKRCDCGASLAHVRIEESPDPARPRPSSQSFFFFARLVAIPGVMALAVGAAFHAGIDILIQIGWACILLALVLTSVGAVKRRREPSPEPMRPYALFLAAPASMLTLWAGLTNSHNGLVFGFSFILIVWAFFRSAIELTFGRLARDWRAWFAFALCVSYYWNYNYAPCFGAHPSFYSDHQCFEGEAPPNN